MTTTRTTPAPLTIACATNVTMLLRRYYLASSPSTFTIRNVPGAFGVAVAITFHTRRGPLMSQVRKALASHGLVFDRDRELLVASVPQPIRTPGLAR